MPFEVENALAMANPKPKSMGQVCSQPASTMLSQTRLQCNLSDEAVVEDIFPCTDLQEAYIVSTVEEPGTCINKYVYKIRHGVDLSRFKSAWEATIAKCPNLRTRIITFEGSLMQAVVKENASWDVTLDFEVQAPADSVSAPEMTYGSRLCQYKITNGDRNEKYFMLIMHRAISDSWTMQLVTNTLQRFYDLESFSPDLESNAGFVRYTKEIDTEGAAKYWLLQLKDAMRCPFPPCKTKGSQIFKPRAYVRKEIEFLDLNSAATAPENLLRAAWAIVLSRYSDADDVCFGAVVSGRHAPVERLDRVVGQVSAVLPVRARLHQELTVKAFLQQIERDAAEMIPYEQFGLRRIQKLNSGAREACEFSSLLAIENSLVPGHSKLGTDHILELPAKETSWQDQQLASLSDYAITLQLGIYDTHIEFTASYDAALLVEAQIIALYHHFDRVIRQLISSPNETLLCDISLAGHWDLQQATAWNGDGPTVIDDCIHNLIERQQPDAPAIDAWDGKLTYGELNSMADRLARHLSNNLGVASGELIHVCFEKSVWFFVAFLAINKAGAAWIPLDPSQPLLRQQEVVKQTKARISLTSPKQVAICKSLCPIVVEVTAALDRALADEEARINVRPLSGNVPTNNAAYVLFTSGSTGTPKGLVIEHKSLCTSQTAMVARLGFTPAVRMLQFASYVFDSCICEIIGTLISGGCVCVPSDEVRWNGLVGFINESRINSALLTPSFIRTMKPEDVPGLKLLILASEALSQDNLDTWLGNVRLINGWGPAEVCVFGSLHELKPSIDESPLTIGLPVGGYCWIVDQKDHNRLAPIGCIGEIVFQSPTILREYLSDEKRSKEAIISPVPEWMPRRAEWNRFFKTGDLGFYNPNGTLEFVGRKDTQIKIRGLRVELEEVEYKIRTMQQDIKEVAVDVVRIDGTARLVAYLCFSGEMRRMDKSNGLRHGEEDIFLPLTETTEARVRELAAQLGAKLPSYMVPTMHIPCRYMPYSTKLDRKRLRKLTTELSKQSLEKYSLVDSKKRPPETPMEIQMQQLWSSILNIPTESIGKDDNFLRIGGDSIGAIRLVSLARSRGISLNVAAIFEDARLSSLASVAVSMNGTAAVTTAPLPYSLLPEGRCEDLLNQARRQCGLSEDQIIEDAYPCTPLQEGLMALAMKEPGSYKIKWMYKLSKQIDLRKFKHAWEQTVALCVNLRTRIALVDGCSLQIVLRDDIEWETWGFLPEGNQACLIAKEASSIEMKPGSRLFRYSLTQVEDGHWYFTLVAHHAVFDGWSLGIAMEQLHRLYKGCTAMVLEPYSRFIQYLTGINSEASSRYWKEQLDNAGKLTFPPSRHQPTVQDADRPRDGPENQPNRSRLTRIIPMTQSTSSMSVTKATVLRAAWAIVLARYCDTADICFGISVSGRHAPVPGLESMSGPLVATVPVRMRLDAEQRVSDFLHDVQAHASGMILHEQFGLQNIIKLSEYAKDACDFSHLLVIQPAEILSGLRPRDLLMAPAETKGLSTADELMGEYFGYPLVVQALLGDTNVEFSATYDPEVLKDTQIEALSHHFDRVVQQLLSPGDSQLGNISLTGSWDVQQAISFNGDKPEFIDDCIHYIIERRARQQPDAPAIFAWDGELTYSELNDTANRVAVHLTNTGVQIGDLIPICFERSLWFYVSVLAIHKAGGAWVPLDPGHPSQRHQEIISQTKSRHVLVSETHTSKFSGLDLQIIEVSIALNKLLIADRVANMRQPTRKVTAHDVAYVLFTSGTTGTPKGVVIEHGSLCTTQTAVAKRLGMTAQVRMLQFSSYVFDAWVFESLCSLISGACLCVPSETARLTGLEDFINTAGVTWADLTPTFLRTLDPSKVKTLELLVIGGEPAGQDLLQNWVGKVRLVNVWGPAETSVISTLHEYTSADESPMTVGRPIGAFCWIVDADDNTRLAPIGCVGEVVVHGPSLLREYLSDPKKTMDAIITPVPKWAPLRTESKYGRFFKTGDLASYNPDGTIRFLGRKDTQVKIRGQRVELVEVEYNIQSLLPDIKQVAVDVLQTAAGTSLVAYLCSSQETRATVSAGKNSVAQEMELDNPNSLFLPLVDEVARQMRWLAGELAERLPTYMVPKVFIPCWYMPYITSTKLDRAKLRQVTLALGSDNLASYSLLDSEKKQAPKTEAEIQMQHLWALVLQVPAETIGRDDSFLQLGGDSISAIRLVSLARRQGIFLTVPSIFKDARLSRMAEIAAQCTD